ncbi:hypothetical protein [Aurantibacter sp.]|uniref:hypothetical protein n=1 Tax=Aurantibacter sp. TaxID=2807103 RepID=UPI0035C7BF46
MKKMTLLFVVLITNLSISQTDIWTSDSEDYTNWTFQDVDNDGDDWQIDDSGNNVGFGFSGTVFFSDANNKTPNNLLKSPTFNINSSLTTLNFEMRIGNAIGVPFTLENYAVYIYDTSVNPTGIYTSATEIINTTANQTSSSEIISATIPSNFAGKNVGIIIRHYNTSGVLGNLLLIDDFKVSSPMNIPNILLSAKVLLQGAYFNPNSGEENLMRDDLRIANYIPTISPYSDALTCNASVFNATGANAIVDWVWLELRDAIDNTVIETSTSALLQRDGDVVSVDGISSLSFNLPNDNYYIAIKHRNHLGIMTANTIALSGIPVSVDFTDANNPITYGTNAQTTFSMPTNILGMWAGDVNNDGKINYIGVESEIPFISSHVFNDPDNSLFGGPPTATYSSLGYYSSDIDLNGQTIYIGVSSDIPFLSGNIFNNPSNSLFGGPPTATYTFTQQLPEGAN